MSWENSKAVTPLKRDFLKAFFAREKRFFLTGGSALGLFYLEHRHSYDVDLFSPDRPEWLELDGVMRVCAEDLGAILELRRDAPTFSRYQLVRGEDSEIIDMVLDISPQVDPDKPWIDDVRVDTLHEIVVNKITTLISRCELKDIVDLCFLEKDGYRIEDYFEEAQQKDGGLDPAMVSLLLDSLQITELPDYLIKPLSLAELCAFVDDLKRRMALMAYPDALKE
ncbi:MAG: nucleotidyl transferase AbiEii/AbiGii toxin family protein [Kiritimatiellae bacterium]|nr:nucleotidyl transferase AbiEii/AbiGii toxin family protein [Kiritimatiellia bacterium]